MEPGRCWITEYSIVQDATYTDLRSHRHFFLLLVLNLGCKTNQRGTIWISPYLTFHGHQGRLLFYEVSTAEKNWCSRRQVVRRYHNGLMYTHCWVPFWTRPSDLLVYWSSFLLVKKQNFQSWEVLDYQDCCISRCQIKRILLYFIITFIIPPMTW